MHPKEVGRAAVFVPDSFQLPDKRPEGGESKHNSHRQSEPAAEACSSSFVLFSIFKALQSFSVLPFQLVQICLQPQGCCLVLVGCVLDFNSQLLLYACRFNMARYTQMPGDMALEGIQLLLQLFVATKRKMWVMKRQHVWGSVLWYPHRAERSS